MISEKLHRQIEEEGKKRDFKFGTCGGEYDTKGKFVFVIRLLPTGNRLAKINEMKKKAIRNRFVSIRLTSYERSTLENLAMRDHLSPSEYFRHLLYEDGKRIEKMK